MATPEAIAELRRKTSEPDTDTYSDLKLDQMIDDNGGDVNVSAVVIWEEKASMYADLVDISEAGSSRKNSQLMTNAQKQADYYRNISQGDVIPETERASTAPIVRPR